MHGLLIEHRTLAGKRDDVKEIWEKFMKPAIAGNSGHAAYAYSFGNDEDVIVAFQVYQSKDDANAFLLKPEYRMYIEASRTLLAGEPKVTVLDVRWLK